MAAARVLVTGGSGFLGLAVVEELRGRGFEVFAPRRAELDLTSADSVRDVVRRTAPEAIVHLAAALPAEAEDVLRTVNVHGAELVAEASRALGARLVHVASDAGHDGRAAPYADAAPMHPITAYGRSKADGERRVLAVAPDAVSVRTSLLWDPDAMDRGTASLARRLAAGEPCVGYVDEIRCPLPRRALAACLADLVSAAHSGPLNVAGREPVSRHDFAVALLRHFGVPGRERLRPVRVADLEAAGAPPRPRDLRLAVDRVERLLGRRMPGVSELLSDRTA